MRKYFKMAVMVILLCAFTAVLSGCNEKIKFEFKFDGEQADYMSDKYVDILIPFDGNHFGYIDYNDPFKNSGNTNVPDIPVGSEIVEYNDTGFSSVLFHLNGAEYIVLESTYNNERWLELGSSYRGSDGKRKFCDNYKKMRIAVFDGSGNIISVSDEVPLIRSGKYYIKFYNLKFDPVNNTFDPEYNAPSEVVMLAFFFGALGVGGVFVLLILALTALIVHKTDGVNYKVYTIISAIMTAPSVITLILSLRIEMCTHLSVLTAIKSFFDSFGILIMFMVMLSMGILAYFGSKLYFETKENQQINLE